MIIWGVEEDEPEQTVTVTPGAGVTWADARQPFKDDANVRKSGWGIGEPVPDTAAMITITPTPPVVWYWRGPDGIYRPCRESGWPQAWRIVGWMLIAGALGAAIGVWIVLTIYLDS